MFNVWVSFSVLIRSLSCHTCCDIGPRFLWSHSTHRLSVIALYKDRGWLMIKFTAGFIWDSSLHIKYVSLAGKCWHFYVILQLCFCNLYVFVPYIFLFFDRFVKFRTICLIDFMLFYFLFEYISLISVIVHVQRSATDHSAAITFCKKKTSIRKSAFKSLEKILPKKW